VPEHTSSTSQSGSEGRYAYLDGVRAIAIPGNDMCAIGWVIHDRCSSEVMKVVGQELRREEDRMNVLFRETAAMSTT